METQMGIWESGGGEMAERWGREGIVRTEGEKKTERRERDGKKLAR